MRYLLILLGVALALASASGWWLYRAYGPWNEWEHFAEHFIQPDGRVVDITANARSTSEGQSYSLFFALVADDRERFDRILEWTKINLAGGDFSRQLPAWLWGARPDGSWGVIDSNAASDADLWLAYTLLEAGRLWKAPYLTQTGLDIVQLIKQRELVVAGQWGRLLLPAPKGFVLEDGRFRLNPSYFVRAQFAALARADSSGPWADVLVNMNRVVAAATAQGLAPDWFVVDAQGHVYPDIATPNVGSYDAIRVYLWAALDQAIEPRAALQVGAFADLIQQMGRPPEIVDVKEGTIRGGDPIGFSAAVLPYLERLGKVRLLKKQQKRLDEQRVAGHLGQPPHYYDQVLGLFGEGAYSRRYRFENDGRVTVRWENLWVGL